MTRKEYIEKMKALDAKLELAFKHNDDKAATEIGKEIESLMSSAMDEFSEEEMLEMAFILDNS
jgi:hypothetical protein